MDENGTTNVAFAGECEEIFVRESVVAGAHEAATKTGETPSAEGNDFVPFSVTPLLPRLHLPCHSPLHGQGRPNQS